jgi:hypothetical protein
MASFLDIIRQANQSLLSEEERDHNKEFKHVA